MSIWIHYALSTPGQCGWFLYYCAKSRFMWISNLHTFQNEGSTFQECFKVVSWIFKTVNSSWRQNIYFFMACPVTGQGTAKRSMVLLYKSALSVTFALFLENYLALPDWYFWQTDHYCPWENWQKRKNRWWVFSKNLKLRISKVCRGSRSVVSTKTHEGIGMHSLRKWSEEKHK